MHTNIVLLQYGDEIENHFYRLKMLVDTIPNMGPEVSETLMETQEKQETIGNMINTSQHDEVDFNVNF